MSNFLEENKLNVKFNGGFFFFLPLPQAVIMDFRSDAPALDFPSLISLCSACVCLFHC
jgi:hypothetical protein